ALPNLLAGEELVPELLQEAATPANLAQSLLAQQEPRRAAMLVERFLAIHQQLQQDAGALASGAIAKLLEK
ncbi:MAG: lipid-A-disaccharide synthase, partial [Cellvibrionaceae bacterium]|nr:lipid-A-disaccharide synthase [Cellvibrionaceae bacterium]